MICLRNEVGILENWIDYDEATGGLIIGNKVSYAGYTLQFGNNVEIKCIKNFYFKEFPNSLHLIIHTSVDCKILRYDFTNEIMEELTSVTIILNKSFPDNDMKNRFTLAFNNLIIFRFEYLISSSRQ